MRNRNLRVLLVAGGLLALVAITGGCGGSSSSQASDSKLSKEQYAKIQNGMSADQMKSMLGSPSRTETNNSGGHTMGNGMTMGGMTMENWYYEGENGTVKVEISDDKVTNKSGY